MRVIARRALQDFAKAHPKAKGPLDVWWALMKAAKFANFAELKQTFGAVDSVGDSRFVFDISGNHYRIVARIFFRPYLVYILYVFTHREYDDWNDLGRP